MVEGFSAFQTPGCSFSLEKSRAGCLMLDLIDCTQGGGRSKATGNGYSNAHGASRVDPLQRAVDSGPVGRQ